MDPVILKRIVVNLWTIDSMCNIQIHGAAAVVVDPIELGDFQSKNLK